MLTRVNMVLGFVLVIVFALLGLMQVDHSKPNYQVNLGDDMTYSPAYGAFDPNDNFANRRTMQVRVPGTMMQDEQVFHYAATPQDAIRAGEELTNPFDLNTKEGVASAKRGAAAFHTFCVACHGGDGKGNGLVAQRGFPPPPSLLSGKSKDMKDGQLFHILTYGQNSMPWFAAQLSPSRRWDLINHIRTLQKAERESLQAAQQAEREKLQAASEKPDTEQKPGEQKPTDEPESKP